MTIDPLTIPCAYCGGFPDRYDNSQVYCQYCLSLEDEDAVLQTDDDWITGGINALVGKLVRSGVEVWKSEDGWTWDSEDDAGKAWQTFEYCVLDAWEKAKMGEGEG